MTPTTQGIDTWLQRWEKTYADAVKIKMPEVQDEKPLYDFLLSIQELDPMFVAIQESSFKEKLHTRDPLPSLYDLLERYRNHLRTQRATSKSPSHSAFAAYQGETTKDSKKPSSLNTGSKEHKPCLCGEMHPFRRFSYLIESVRTPEWLPNREIESDPKIERDS